MPPAALWRMTKRGYLANCQGLSIADKLIPFNGRADHFTLRVNDLTGMADDTAHTVEADTDALLGISRQGNEIFDFLADIKMSGNAE